MARLAREEFGLAHLVNVTLVEADAFTWVETCEQIFDLICVDLYVAGELVHGTLATPFLREIARLLTPGGTAAFNLFRTKRLPEQLHRLERVFLETTTYDLQGLEHTAPAFLRIDTEGLELTDDRTATNYQVHTAVR